MQRKTDSNTDTHRRRAELFRVLSVAFAELAALEEQAPRKRGRGRPRKTPPEVTAADVATLAKMGVRLGGSK